MPVIIGQLDVIAAPAAKKDTPPGTKPQGLTVGELDRMLDGIERRRRRREAD